MAITPADFKTRFPEFASIADSRVQIFLDDAECELDPNIWDLSGCDLFERGVFYLAAHLLTLNERGQKTPAGSTSGVGMLTMKRAGEVSVSYGGVSNMTASDSYLSSTIYGQEFMRLQRKVGFGAVSLC